MRRVVLIVLSPVFFWWPLAVAAAKLPAVVTDGRFVVKPATIDYTGDGSALVGGRDGTSIRHPGHLKWTTYTRRQGIADGLLWIDNCMPNCAYGKFTSTRVHVNVYSPSNGYFRRLKLTYNYHGHHYVDVRVVKNRSYTFPGL
jgi:hypothetical protein